MLNSAAEILILLDENGSDRMLIAFRRHTKSVATAAFVCVSPCALTTGSVGPLFRPARIALLPGNRGETGAT